MNLFDVIAATESAKRDIRLADDVIKNLAYLMSGRMHVLDHRILRDLKRELSRYEVRKGKWKN